MLLDVPSRERLRALHIGGYWRGPNDMVRQMMLGLGATGAEVVEYSTDEHPEALDTEGRLYDRGTTGPVWLSEEALRPAIAELRPHLIVCNAGGLSFRPAPSRELRRRACLLGIALSDPDVFEPTTRYIAPNFDRFLTNAPECVPRYRELGVSAELLPIATNDAFFRPVPSRPELVCDVLVMGRAHPDRVEPVRALCASFDTHLYGEGWSEHGLASRGLIFGEDALAALSSARMVVIFFRTGAGHALVKVGLFDFAAAGALVLTERFAAVEPYFRYDEEILGFSSTPELLAKVRHYLDHPEQAEAVRRAGRARVLADHTWPRVWPRVIADLGKGPAEPADASERGGWWPRLRRWFGAAA
jgi:spore maturation protein CgeB